MITTNINHLNREENDFRDKLKRWQELSPQLDDFLLRATPGDIFYEKGYHPYAPGASPHFRNTPLAEPFSSSLKLENGRTLVDFGFVDFGFVFDSIKTLDMSGDPLTVVGYEASPQCVAKSLVMIQMMEDGDVPGELSF